MDFARSILLAILLSLPGGAMAQSVAPRAASTATATATADCADCVVVDYGGQKWQIDPALGPVQAVVTQRVINPDGVVLRGLVFIHDDGGWRAAGTFEDDAPSAELKDANVYTELKLVAAGQ
jgi:hypothetical protein